MIEGIFKFLFSFLVVKCILIASPGFVKNQFMDYMLAEAVKQDIKVLLENKSKFLLVSGSIISFKIDLIISFTRNNTICDYVLYITLLIFFICVGALFHWSQAVTKRSIS